MQEEKEKEEELNIAEDAQDEGTEEQCEAEEKDPLEAAEEKIKELEDKYLRLMAEFDNFRRRVTKEKAELILNGGEKVLTELLPIIDDIERAQANIEKAQDVDSIKEGVNLIMEKFTSYLKKEGVSAIEAVGKDFDTEYHEAIAMVPGQPEAMKGWAVTNLRYCLNQTIKRMWINSVANLMKRLSM